MPCTRKSLPEDTAVVVSRTTDSVVMARTETRMVGGAEFMSNLPVPPTKRTGRILLHTAGSKTLGGHKTSLARLRPKGVKPGAATVKSLMGLSAHESRLNLNS